MDINLLLFLTVLQRTPSTIRLPYPPITLPLPSTIHAIAKVAPVSVDLMTWSVFAAKGMTLPVTKLLGTSVWKSEVCLLVTRHRSPCVTCDVT